VRSFKVYGIKDGGAETYVDTAYSPAEGKQIHTLMKTQGYFDEMVVRDVLGGVQIRRTLKAEATV
jgi:hypothetical protein